MREYREIIAQYLPFARCFGSKSMYREKHPDHLVVFNARIYVTAGWEKVKNMKPIEFFFEARKEEVWYGDLDFNLDLDTLRKIRSEIDTDLYISTENGSLVCKIFKNKVEFEKGWRDVWEEKR